MKSDTPRTDATIYRIANTDYPDSDESDFEFADGSIGPDVDAIASLITFARTLERDLARVTAENEALKDKIARGAISRIALEVENQAMQKDKERIDWLEKKPRHAEIIVDGKTLDCVFYGISADNLMPLRDAIDAAIKEGS